MVVQRLCKTKALGSSPRCGSTLHSSNGEDSALIRHQSGFDSLVEYTNNRMAIIGQGLVRMSVAHEILVRIQIVAPKKHNACRRVLSVGDQAFNLRSKVRLLAAADKHDPLYFNGRRPSS